MRQLLTQSDRVSMYSGSTLLVGTADGQTGYSGKETYLSFAKKMLSTASAAASTRSSLSTVSPQIDPPPLIELGGSSPSQLPDRRRTIADWIPPDMSTPNLMDMSRSASMSTMPPDMPQPKSKLFEVAYKLTQQHLRLGQEKTEKNEHESAERCFRRALQLLEKHDFADRIAFQPAEVVLMLSNACLMQKKYDEAIGLLDPVAERESDIFPRSGSRAASTSQQPPDKLQALAASHMLGEVYKQKGDYESAKEHSLTAFMERTDELGEHDEKTLESVRLVIEVYRAMGDEEEAEAYEVFLAPAPAKQVRSHISSSRESREIVYSDEQTAVPSISPPPSEVIISSPIIQDRKTGRPSFTSRFKTLTKPSQTSLAQPTSHPEQHRKSFSRAATLDNASHDPGFLNPRHLSTSHLSSPSETSYERTNSYMDDDSTAPSSARLERTSSTRLVEPTFQAVEQLCDNGDFTKAAKIALKFLKGYESNAFIYTVRKDELEKNIRKGAGKGLASTGEGYSPLHYFCELKDECVDEVALILKYGADPNAAAYKAGFTSSSSTGILTPLNLAINRGHNQISRLLLETKGIRTDVKDANGLYPLLAACRSRQYETVKLLLNHAPHSIPTEYPADWYGCSPLHDAARHCDLALVEIFLSRRDIDRDLLNVNLQDKFGKTPLMHAIIKTDVSDPQKKARWTKERMAVVEALLEAGADAQVVDNKGNSARKYADLEGGQEGKMLADLVGEVRYEMA